MRSPARWRKGSPPSPCAARRKRFAPPWRTPPTGFSGHRWPPAPPSCWSARPCSGSSIRSFYPVMVILAIGLLARAALGRADVVFNMLVRPRARCSSLHRRCSAPLWSLRLAWAATATSLALVAAAAGNGALARRRLNLRTAIWHNSAVRGGLLVSSELLVSPWGAHRPPLPRSAGAVRRGHRRRPLPADALLLRARGCCCAGLE
jgi:hypothetical protein